MNKEERKAIQKVIDCMEGKTTSQASPLDQLKSIIEKKQQAIEIIIPEGLETEDYEFPEYIKINFDKKWFLVCSYVNKRTMERNYVNILLKQDQFPNIKQCQEAIEEKKGFAVTGVVLVNWKEVSNDYEL